jgi:hypothetical protein
MQRFGNIAQRRSKGDVQESEGSGPTLPAVARSELGRRQRGHDVRVVIEVAAQLGYSIAEEEFSKVSALS